jgi:hypothetical protein
MQCIERVQGMSFERLEHKSTSEGSFKMKDMPNLRFLSVQNCDDVCVLFDILKHSVHLRWLKIHFSLENDKFVKQPKSFAKNFWKTAQTFLHQMCVLKFYNCDFLNFNPSSSFMFSLSQRHITNKLYQFRTFYKNIEQPHSLGGA